MLDLEKGCRTLLLELFKLSQKTRLDEHILLPQQVAMILRVDLADTIVFVDFLERKGYIRCGRPVGSHYSWIKLTSQGMELVMNPANLDTVFHVSASDEVQVLALGAATREKIAQGTDVPDETLFEIEQSLSDVVYALRQKDDQPLREFLSDLILRGGIDTTVVGVKALLAIHGVEL
ncbi:hypothetical protein NZD89_05930 [Alicyclobacillus fastidiosus]|uniref:Transcriptional regulator n=1 Tax=Alicyclobacillus fastidiosus TaxID=392011 RepID=A0ABY6ZLG4_9BACL|nr:hypothetical protein [Alicyclobacillus fastidiosus]WAH42956.1 hypothetical protein NZD89_05930 [Alicyclobacillus fastidiosus]GMA64918.1 hypothetical protein GCM10025859_53580 [Alicyclobacillus fastidiosus]